MNKPVIAIIGAGAVGTTTAYALMLTHAHADILLIDVNQTRCTGEIMDLADVAPLCQAPSVAAANSDALTRADIIIIAAGKRQEPGQSRAELLATNKKIIIDMLSAARPLKPTALMIMVSNPLDVLTYHAQKASGLPHNQVFGSGTFLDSIRMRELVAQEVGVDPASVHAYILGEHGDHQFSAWSSAEIGGKPLSQFTQLSATVLASIAQHTRDKAYEIIACKGSTFYGIATCVARLCHAILSDEKLVVPLSCYLKEYDLYLSMPVVLGAHGIEQIIDISLDQTEQVALNRCISEIKKML